MPDVTQLLNAAHQGQTDALHQLLPLVYEELRQLASRQLAQEKPGQTLQPTALVHEAYLRLVPNAEEGFANRRYFFAAAAEAMRRILVERYRQKQSLKQGAGWARQPVEELAAGEMPANVLDVHEALDGLQAVDPVSAELVKLRYFAGCTQAEAATVLELPRRSADRLWAFARAWLYRALSEDSR